MWPNTRICSAPTKEIAIDVEQILLREGILRDWDYQVIYTSAEISEDDIYSSISLHFHYNCLVQKNLMIAGNQGKATNIQL